MGTPFDEKMKKVLTELGGKSVAERITDILCDSVEELSRYTAPKLVSRLSRFGAVFPPGRNPEDVAEDIIDWAIKKTTDYSVGVRISGSATVGGDVIGGDKIS